MKVFDHQKIERKWCTRWLKNKIHEPDLKNAKRPFYNLMMFPYPSAEGLHVGNMYAFTGSDIYGRMKRMQGYDVFEPIGLDGFGIHSENYALKIGKHPFRHAKDSEKNFYRQLGSMGNGFAWQERLETYDPKYYRWTQWLFTKMFKNGLAYRKKQDVNWCPSCKTVLADEQVISGECERCGTEVVKKALEQWFFKITEYAEKLLKNIEKLDWSEKVKIAQREWIGKSEGASLEFKIKNSKLKIQVFTTRPDTLFGATYMVLAPENPLIQNLESKIQNLEEFKKYIQKARKKTELQRIELAKDKTGVELKGIKAINPANKKEIPVWVADYVLSSYGTGAIMAVPAHDERDFEFAKKYKLPIRKVIVEEFGKKRPNEEFRNGGVGIVFDPKAQKYAVARWKDDGRIGLFAGGVNGGEEVYEAVVREVKEESGLHEFMHIERIDVAYAHFFNKAKKVNRFARAECLLFILDSTKRKPVVLEDHEDFELAWLSADEILSDWEKRNIDGGYSHYMEFLREGVAHAIELGYDKTSNRKKYCTRPFMGHGFLENSEKFNNMPSEKAKWGITKFVGGKKQTQYHLRDWLISRQRYWGPPIPMIYCEHCAGAGRGEREDMPGWYAVPEKDLPVKLPMIKDFQPKGKGESPLASIRSFYEVKCPGCGGKARRETDVSDTFLDSSWYFLRYPSVSNKNHAWGLEITKKWLPVNMYIGGAEHSVLHLLYSRFMTMAAHDWELVDFEEPFSVFRAHGLLIREGGKISKSKGNIVNPDEYIAKFGADTFRMYLMFLAPFEQGGDFRDQAILGVRRFLLRVWNFGNRLTWNKKTMGSANVKKVLHLGIKKITEDIEILHYNTAISGLMMLLNAMEESVNSVLADDFETFLKLLAPFAPFIAEELWHEIGHKTSIHLRSWPKYDPKLIKEEKFELVIQVNGRVRDRVSVPAGIKEEEARKVALLRDKVKNIIGSQKIKKTIFVPNRLINIVTGT